MSTQKIDPLLQQVLEQVEGSFNENICNDITASATKDVVDISTNYLYKVEYLFVYKKQGY